jgi:UDP:flavonoid glycosyltransferase YjiC (YdhE family)
MACHGGFGTVLGALSAGVPVAVLPLFADQPYNAARVAALGAGIALERGPAGVGGLRSAVEALLADPGYAERAAAIAADVRALPDVDAAAALLAELAAVGAPARP